MQTKEVTRLEGVIELEINQKQLKLGNDHIIAKMADLKTQLESVKTKELTRLEAVSKRCQNKGSNPTQVTSGLRIKL